MAGSCSTFYPTAQELPSNGPKAHQNIDLICSSRISCICKEYNNNEWWVLTARHLRGEVLLMLGQDDRGAQHGLSARQVALLLLTGRQRVQHLRSRSFRHAVARLDSAH